MLSDAISRMTTTLKEATREQKEQNWFKTGQAELNDRMRGEQDVDALSRNTITFLSEYLGAQVGALYLVTSEDKLILKGTYALTRRKHLNNQFTMGEGLVGQCALERKEIMIDNLPEDYLPVHSGTGSAAPANVLVVPFLYENQVKGVIELGAFSAFSDIQINFLKDVIENIAINFNTAQARNQMAELLTQTQSQAAVLQKQQEKLRASNEELEEQTRLLKDSEERLQVQQEELRQTNEELLEKSTILEEQKTDIEKKNAKLKQAQLEIEQKAKDLELSGKYKSEFLANMSHELRTPLNSMLILSDLLCKNKEGKLSEKEANYARTIHSSGNDLLNLINEILDLSKIEAGKMALNIEAFGFKDLQRDILNTFEPVAKEKGLDFNVRISDQIPGTMESDRLRLSQILKNLLSNALKFTRQGSVNLAIERPSEDVALPELNLPLDQIIAFHVNDTGKGINKDKQKLIFEAFQQEDGSTSRKFGGTGLGLSISRELAKLLGGVIKLHSVEGQGSTFSVYLPQRLLQGRTVQKQTEPEPREIITQADEPAQDPDTPAIDPVEYDASPAEVRDDRHYLGSEDCKLLIIEDDPKFAEILMHLGHQKDYKCLLAMDGEAGLFLAQHYRPQAIILDIGLPGMNGWDVLKRLKDSLDTRHIPVHCISAADQSPQAVQMGAVGYLVKPVKADQIDEVFQKFEGILDKKICQLLVVEDNDNQRQAIEALIGGNGIAVTTAANGSQAYQLLQSQPFDCMILDLGLPDMTGFELLQTIKSDENIGLIPTIIFTGKELSQKEEAELSQYAQSIILKGSEKSQERLLDETCLFLHQVEKDLPSDKRRIIEKIHNKNSVLKNKKILVVDDDMRNVFALTQVLEGMQMHVKVAKNGREALKHLEQDADIDLILMDIMMPEMDGYEAIREIRKKEKLKKLPIIALTAKAMKGDRSKCIEAGANDYLAKPVDTEKLFSMLRVWLYG
jgi:CheY-like chemotaxis protein/signal transduction histidine kinase